VSTAFGAASVPPDPGNGRGIPSFDAADLPSLLHDAEDGAAWGFPIVRQIIRSTGIDPRRSRKPRHDGRRAPFDDIPGPVPASCPGACLGAARAGEGSLTCSDDTRHLQSVTAALRRTVSTCSLRRSAEGFPQSRPKSDAISPTCGFRGPGLECSPRDEEDPRRPGGDPDRVRPSKGVEAVGPVATSSSNP